MKWLFGTLAEEIAGLRHAVNRLAMSCREPVVLVRLVTQEQHQMLIYSVSAGPPVDEDVVSRELTVMVNGSQASQVTFGGSSTDLGEVRASQGDSVVMLLVDIDDAGNRSDAARVEFTAIDTIPPSRPGEFGVTLVREEA